MLTHFLDDLRRCARMLVPGTSTALYYLGQIETIRRITNTHAVIFDDDYCIVVL